MIAIRSESAIFLHWTTIISRCAMSIGVALALFATTVDAAEISWFAGPTYGGTTGYQAIDTTGTLVKAVNAYAAGSDLVVDPSGLNITFNSEAPMGSGKYGSGSPGSNDAAWNTIVNNTNWNGADGTSFSLPGLTIGNTYQVQLFGSDTRTCCGNRTQYYTDGEANASMPIRGNAFNSVLGQFTADAATQSIRIYSSATDPVLDAYVLNDVTGETLPTHPSTVRPMAIAEHDFNRLKMIDGSGLSAGATDDRFAVHVSSGSIPNQGYFSGGGAGKQLVIELGNAYDLNSILFWNGLQANQSDRQITKMKVQTSNELTLTAAQSNDLNDTASFASIDVPIYGSSNRPHTAFELPLAASGLELADTRFVRFFDFTTNGENIGVIAEVRFGADSPPSLPSGGMLGNSLSPRTYATDGSTQVFWSNYMGAPVDGTVDSVDLYHQGGNGSFELFQLRPTGAANEYDVIAASGSITTGGAAGSLLNVGLPNGPFEMQKGDILAHYGNGIAYSSDSTSADAHNNQFAYWKSIAAPTVDDTITLGGSGAFPQPSRILNRDYAWAVQLDGFVETIGNGAGPGKANPDGAHSLLVVMDNDPFTQRGYLDSWQFFNDVANTGGRLVTPVLLREENDLIEVIGLGTTQTGTNDGFQQYDFELVDGTNLALPGDLFGFYYGDETTGNKGSIEYTQVGSQTIRLFRQLNGLGLGDTFADGTQAYNLARYYSVNVTTIIPEPSSLVLFGIALLGLMLAWRKRKVVSE